MRILVTRPAPAGEELCEKIRATGDQTFFMPTIEIAPPRDEKELQQALTALHTYHWLIFISPQAVRMAEPWLQSVPSHLKLAAIGPGTARALTQAGYKVALHAEKNASAAAMLALPDFSKIKNMQIGIIQGEGGRPELAEVLAARGAIVKKIIVYRRLCAKPENIGQYHALLAQKKIDMIVSASGASLQNLVLLTYTDRAILFKTPVIVVSERLVKLARNLGFSQIFLSEGAGHDAIIGTRKKFKCRGV